MTRVRKRLARLLQAYACMVPALVLWIAPVSGCSGGGGSRASEATSTTASKTSATATTIIDQQQADRLTRGESKQETDWSVAMVPLVNYCFELMSSEGGVGVPPSSETRKKATEATAQLMKLVRSDPDVIAVGSDGNTDLDLLDLEALEFSMADSCPKARVLLRAVRSLP
jgi:hypothetical protein